jgi:hypothetical protein
VRLLGGVFELLAQPFLDLQIYQGLESVVDLVAADYLKQNVQKWR